MTYISSDDIGCGVSRALRQELDLITSVVGDHSKSTAVIASVAIILSAFAHTHASVTAACSAGLPRFLVKWLRRVPPDDMKDSAIIQCVWQALSNLCAGDIEPIIRSIVIEAGAARLAIAQIPEGAPSEWRLHICRACSLHSRDRFACSSRRQRHQR